MDPYNDLLEATITHLNGLKRQGTRFLPVSPDLLKSLGTQPARWREAQPQSGSSSPQFKLPGEPVPQNASPTPAPPRAPAKHITAVPPVSLPAAAPLAEPIVFSNNADKLVSFTELRERALLCQKCPTLAASPKNLVFGVGSIDAQLMFIGEAPGADEDEQAEPFVGKAGQLLTKIIQTMGLAREQVYIANILKCRPDTPGQASGNRPPTPEEMERCLPYLHAQIDLIKPKAIVALGATAVDGLFGKVPGIGITKLRGTWREYRGIPVMPTYHPSYLLRPNPNNIKRETWEDMLQVMHRLHIPISEKQRAYFLKPAA